MNLKNELKLTRLGLKYDYDRIVEQIRLTNECLENSYKFTYNIKSHVGENFEWLKYQFVVEGLNVYIKPPDEDGNVEAEFCW